MQRSTGLRQDAPSIGPIGPIGAHPADIGAGRTLARGGTGEVDSLTGEAVVYEFEIVRRPDSTLWVQFSRAGEPPVAVPSVILYAASAAYADVQPATDNVVSELHASVRDGHLDLGYKQAFGPFEILLLGMIAAMLVALVLLLRRARRDKRNRQTLEAAARVAIDSRESERLRIARELHDGPVQTLNSVRMRLSSSSLMDDADLLAELQETIVEVRSIAEDLRPPALGPFGLAVAIESLVSRAAAHHPGVTVLADVEPEREPLPMTIRLSLFRIAQEALTNALNHAHPTVVVVRFRHEAEIELCVTDNGVGFSAPFERASLGTTGRFGMLGIAERVAILEGQFTVEQGYGGGTQIAVLVPLPRPAVSASHGARTRRRRAKSALASTRDA